MATVTLDRVWLSLASNPASALAFFSRERSDQRAVPAEVRRYANGRLRVISRAGSAQTLGFTAVGLTAEQVRTLTGWSGQVVLFRDVWGRRLFGMFSTLDVTDATDRSGQDVKVTLLQVTYVEAV